LQQLFFVGQRVNLLGRKKTLGDLLSVEFTHAILHRFADETTGLAMVFRQLLKKGPAATQRGQGEAGEAADVQAVPGGRSR
jgi:hypothetical protein